MTYLLIYGLPPVLGVYTLIKLIWEPAGSEQNITSIKLRLLLFVFDSRIQVVQNRLAWGHTEKKAWSWLLIKWKNGMSVQQRRVQG